MTASDIDKAERISRARALIRFGTLERRSLKYG